MPIALEAVATAMSITRAVQHRLQEVSGHLKDDRSPVTVADYAAQAVVSMLLREGLSDQGLRRIVGEEDGGELSRPNNAALLDAVTAAVRLWRGDVSQAQVLEAIDACNHDASGDCWWTLDPVDGTKGFLRGGQYAIALGLIVDGQVHAGVLGCPNLSVDPGKDPAAADSEGSGMLYGAQQGLGAWEFRDGDPAATPMRITCPAWTDDKSIRCCASVESHHTNKGQTSELLDAFENDRIMVRLDSQAKYAVLARGQADAYLRLPTRDDYRECIWDHAAGALVATEAGAVVTDVRGKELDFTTGQRLQNNRGVIAAADGLQQRLIERAVAMGVGSP
ncbi:MAG: 3'(2'),5'-bisphosphate nucleotidase [Phycisphaerales bacterium]|nr:3'(2'),5'-bisphosphate nucleotidase [Phycisphaerales bacterium]